jgi:predicted aconitase
MILEEFDKSFLAGDFGAAAQRAMGLLVRYGEVMGAERFIDIESAHIDGCLYHGPSGLDFVNSFLESGDKVRVPTTLNVTAVDLVHPEYSDVAPRVTTDQRAMVEAYCRLGCRPTLTCAPYQRLQRPRAGQHVAWAESNAIVFANSVLGARTDRYGDFTDLCAALAGRVPLAGLHRDENRRATLLVEVESPQSCGLERDLYFACLGYVLGEEAGSRVAAIAGLPPDASEDELKALGAAAASSGPVAMFHAVGVTPEAQTLEQAFGGPVSQPNRVKADASRLRAVVSRLCPAEAGEPVAAVCLGTPHFSLAEFRVLADRLGQYEKAAGVEVLVSTSRSIADEIRQLQWAHPLWDHGVNIIVDTCTYLNPVVLQGDGVVVTNSAKWAHYAPGNIGRRAALMSLDRCLRCAAAGKVVA